jgi:hypothetical protein
MLKSVIVYTVILTEVCSSEYSCGHVISILRLVLTKEEVIR